MAFNLLPLLLAAGGSTGFESLKHYKQACQQQAPNLGIQCVMTPQTTLFAHLSSPMAPPTRTSGQLRDETRISLEEDRNSEIAPLPVTSHPSFLVRGSLNSTLRQREQAHRAFLQLVGLQYYADIKRSRSGTWVYS